MVLPSSEDPRGVRHLRGGGTSTSRLGFLDTRRIRGDRGRPRLPSLVSVNRAIGFRDGKQGEKDMTETAIMTRQPQRLRALERANEIRLARAVLKRQIADGHISAAEVILSPPRAAMSWAVGDLLMSQRRWGTTRCRKFLLRNQINENRSIGALTERQRRLLADQLCSRDTREEGLALIGA